MCLASLKSMTYAIKAKKVLSQHNIQSEIIKLDSSLTQKGCLYGITFDCSSIYAVENILKNNNVKYSQIFTKY